MESSNHLPLQAHQSIDFGELANNRFVVKRDGNKEYYDSAILLKYLTGCLTGLNEENFNLDLIVDKVTKGLYNGKSLSNYLTLSINSS
jgi:hypothetical protein